MQNTIELNVTAPNFVLKDIFGRTIELHSYKGKKVFLGFFRHAGCPFCNIRVHALQKKRDELLALNMEMIFFFESKDAVLQQSIFHKEISPIPLIGDPNKIMYETYGIEQSAAKSIKSHLTTFIQSAIKAKMAGVPMHTMASGESFNTMPAEFLIDENSIIRKIHYSKSLTDRMSFEHIYQFANTK